MNPLPFISHRLFVAALNEENYLRSKPRRLQPFPLAAEPDATGRGQPADPRSSAPAPAGSPCRARAEQSGS